ncbi:MAG: hypothetical protein H6711_23435 [Myxococcales bacterium]|nr:hypothetical protein [Myxococcales bacterium]
MARLTLDEAIEFLQAIEAGAVTLRTPVSPQRIFAGDVTYAASNGWTLVVYVDANEWDYVARVVSDDGRTLSREDAAILINRYTASDEVAWARYRIPGYRRRRCEGCGRDIKQSRESRPRSTRCRGCGGVHDLEEPAAEG